ncbi:MAG: monooxygenase, partial [Sphingomonadaceae bacterium]
VPHLGKSAKEVYVFQRTPSGVSYRGDRPTDTEWAASLKPGWQRERMDNMTNLLSGLPVKVDLVDDGWTQPVWDMMHSMSPDATDEERAEQMQLADYRAMEIARRRVDETVKDKETAEALKPWYNRMCKRPCFHDDYLPAFNRPNVHLVDTMGHGVDEITADSIIVGDNKYKIDCLIFATGFDLSAYSGRETMPVYGRGGLELSEKWKEGALTLHGMTVDDFPNLFILSTTQSAWGPNFPHMMDEQAIHIAYIISEVENRKAKTVEATSQAVNTWVRHHENLAPIVMDRWTKGCPPSFWNEEGQANASTLRNGPYGHGVPAMVAILQQWRAKGDLEGILLDGKPVRQAETTV